MKTAHNVRDLVQAGLLSEQEGAAVSSVTERYAVAVTPYLAEQIAASDPDDVLRRQYIPTEAEGHSTAEELVDPIGDEAHSPVKGIVHRYPDRVLLKPLHACAVYCRFCFRREMVGPGGDALSPDELEHALSYIRDHSEIWEVVITGGDPLVLSPRRIGHLMNALAAIPHVAVIRLHTRVPVADPDRINSELVEALKVADAAVWVAVHVNHADELTNVATGAIARLVDAGIPLISQTVLLKGINDTAAALDGLFRALVRRRVKPYYLHHPDLAAGTSHFRPSLAEGQALVRSLRGRLSGLCQPTYVLDIPGGHGKAPAATAWIQPRVEDMASGTADYDVEDYTGSHHNYRG
jgi:lysine 2,3-aminomutase